MVKQYPKGKRGYKYRSRFEASLAKSLQNKKISFDYETERIPFILEKTYVPDFIIHGIFIEAKGVLTVDDRRKLLAVKAQHPEIDLRIVFQNANNKLSKNSVTTYAMWAEKHDFLWAHQTIPQTWLKE